jgi:hypothetical protein
LKAKTRNQLVASSINAFDRRPKPFGRFSFAWLNERELPEAVRRLAAAMQ